MKQTLLSGIFLFVLFESAVSSQDSLLYTNHIFSDKIKTVQLYKEGWNLSYPVIRLGKNEKLTLQFDLIGNEAVTYYYSIIHCDKYWKKSGIFYTDFQEGYSENQIEEYKPSFNTTVGYYHYKLTFPNERITLKLSGNYILLIYPQGEPDKPVITRRFMITGYYQAKCNSPEAADDCKL